MDAVSICLGFRLWSKNEDNRTDQRGGEVDENSETRIGIVWLWLRRNDFGDWHKEDEEREMEDERE